MRKGSFKVGDIVATYYGTDWMGRDLGFGRVVAVDLVPTKAWNDRRNLITWDGGQAETRGFRQVGDGKPNAGVALVRVDRDGADIAPESFYCVPNREVRTLWDEKGRALHDAAVQERNAARDLRLARIRQMEQDRQIRVNRLAALGFSTASVTAEDRGSLLRTIDNLLDLLDEKSS